MKPYILTNSLRRFYFEEPSYDSITIEDIAFHLSYINRFTGAFGPYNVAQHSVLVAEAVVEEYLEEGGLRQVRNARDGWDLHTLALSALLHDSPEAYLNDISSPLKRTPNLRGYKEIEHRVQAAILVRFELNKTTFSDMSGAIKRQDVRALATEARDLIAAPNGEPGAQEICDWGIIKNVEPWKEKITIWDPEISRRRFLAFFEFHLANKEGAAQCPA